jgi:hypothetical protein
VPVGIGEHITDRGQDWRQHRGSHGGELQAVHKLGDPDNMTSDHMCATGVMSHDDGVVDQRPNTGVVRHKGEMSSPVNQGVGHSVES